MKTHIIKLLLSSLILLGLSNSALSGEFWRTGNVIRILSGNENFGKCMILMSTKVLNGCPNNGWVSLDCADKYSTGNSKNKLAIALTALAINKKVSVKIDNTKKHNGYCVATRIDIYSSN